MTTTNKKADPQPFILPQNNSINQILDPKDVSGHLQKTQASDETKIVFFGTPDFSAYILNQLIRTWSQPPDTSHQIPTTKSPLPNIRYVVQTVVTTPDAPVGRNKLITPSAVAKVAQKYSIPVLKPDSLDKQFVKNNLNLLTADLFLVASYGKIVPKIVLNIPKFGCLNWHPSLLPKYRGASPIQSAILNGDLQTGVTIMLMDEKMDHGPILAVKKISLNPSDTFESLVKKASYQSIDLLINTVAEFVRGQIQPKPQKTDLATYCKLIKKEDGYFDINNPPDPKRLDRMIRAYYPWPNAWTRWKDKMVKLLPEKMIQIEGKKPIQLADFQNGYPDFPLHL